MKTTDFIQLLQQPQHIEEKQINELQELILKYPYVQSARSLYLKGLKSKESYRYNQELKITAAYATDRSILFDYITSEAFNQNEISKTIKQNTEHLADITVYEADDISVNRSITIDEALKEHIKNAKDVLDPNLFEDKAKLDEDVTPLSASQENTTSNLGFQMETKHDDKTSEEKLEIGKPLKFNKSEIHSFSEWLKLTSFQPIERNEHNTVIEQRPDKPNDKFDESANQNPTEKNKKFELIDKFLMNNPKIIPTKDSPKANLIDEKKLDNDGLMTETLARIYLEQNNYEKAIQSYKILSLKYPEKSGFFADQIKAVKKLQENNTRN